MKITDGEEQSKMKCGCIVVNGTMRDFDFHKSLIHRCDYIVAADGAANELLKMGVAPDCIVGDMDSIKGEVYEHFKGKGIRIVTYPAKKDKTDTELAIDLMAQEGYDQVIMLGCFGSRMDHMLGNIYLVAYGLEKGIRIQIVDEKNRLFPVTSGTTVIKAKKGSIISFLNPGQQAKGISLEGFEYPLKDYDLSFGSTRCISNIATRDDPTITLTEGMLLGVVVDKETG